MEGLARNGLANSKIEQVRVHKALTVGPPETGALSLATTTRGSGHCLTTPIEPPTMIGAELLASGQDNRELHGYLCGDSRVVLHQRHIGLQALAASEFDDATEQERSDLLAGDPARGEL